MSQARKSKKTEKYPVVLVAGIGLGILKKKHETHAVVEFNDGKHKWTIVVTENEYDIVDDINIGYEEI
jgi:hypothetical protein